MLNTILGTKGKMSQTFVEGFRIPVTQIVAGPCVVTQIKKEGKDGYWAVQLGFGERKIKNTTKPMQGHFKASQTPDSKATSFPRYLKEVRLKEEPKMSVGDKLTASDIFRVGDVVTISGTSKGKGFSGVVKRWSFAGGPRTHGQSDRERAPGSIGQTTTPGRVFRGKKMAGRMGGGTVTIKNIHVISVEPEENVVMVSGPVPGNPGSTIIIKKISSGSLKELEHATVAEAIVEGESPASEETAEQPSESEAKENA